MTELQPWWWILLAIGSPILGVVTHEAGHLLFGTIFGGEPFVAESILGVPTLVDFRAPENLTDRQVQVTGGVGFFWLGLLMFGLLKVTFQDLVVLLPVFGFLAGASVISWFDYLAVSEPEAWREFTAGESISREGIGQPRSK